jgi:hypothetical protein
MSSLKTNHNKDRNNEDYVFRELSYSSSSSSNDGKATVSSYGACRMRDSFCMHDNAIAFGIHNGNATTGTTPITKTETKGAKKDTTGTISVNVQTGTTTTKNENKKSGMTPNVEAKTMTAKRIQQEQ